MSNCSDDYEIEKQKYIEGIFITDSTGSVYPTCNELNPWFLKNLKYRVKSFISDIKIQIKTNGGWHKCEDKCKDGLQSIIQSEFESTIFMLHLLTNMVIQANDDKNLLKFEVKAGNKLTGYWEKDKNNINIIGVEKKPRLIMGFGPSASGKTHWAKTIIKLMGKSGEFPSWFLSVDGGKIREHSAVYQTIINEILIDKHIQSGAGFRHALKMKVSGMFNKATSETYGIQNLASDVFDSNKIKDKIYDYLSSLRVNQKNIPSIYVPDTLSSILWQNVITNYRKLTEDNNWIGLYIWQGVDTKYEDKWESYMKKTYTDDLNDLNLTARSTTESGETREDTEGKKYSSVAYGFSKNNGYAALKQAHKAIVIHNTGGRKTDEKQHTSLIIEYPTKSDSEPKYLLTQNVLDKLCLEEGMAQNPQMPQFNNNKNSPPVLCHYLLLHGVELPTKNRYTNLSKPVEQQSGGSRRIRYKFRRTKKRKSRRTKKRKSRTKRKSRRTK
jgi:hypothetical protein